MATPIRWDNINRRPSGEAGQALSSAAAMINSAFGQAQEGLRQHDTIDAANWQNTKVNNTADVMKSLLGYTNAEDYATAQKSGAISQLLGQYGNQVDQQALLKAADDRMGTLQQRTQQALTYQSMIRDEKAAPHVDALRSAILTGNAEAAATARAELASVGYRHFSDQDLFADTRARDLVERDHSDKNFILGQDKGRQEIAASKAHSAYEQGTLGLQRQELGLRRDEMTMRKEDRILANTARLRQEMGATFDSDPRSGNGAKMIADELDKTKDTGLSDNQKRVFTDMLKDPKATTGGILAAIKSLNTRWYMPDFMSRSDAINLGNTVSNSEGSVGQQQALEMRRSSIAEDQNRLRQQLSELQPGYKATNKPGTTRTGSNPFWTSDEVSERLDATSKAARDKAQAEGHYGPQGWEPNTETPSNRLTPEQVAKRDAQIEMFNRTVGGASRRRAEAEAARSSDIHTNYQSYVSTIKPGMDRLERARVLGWIGNAIDSGQLSNAQLKEIRDARKKAGM